MRQRLLLTAIICTLALGGWGGVLAAVLCPHAGSVAHAAMTANVASEHEASGVESGVESVVVVVASTSDDAHECCRARLPRAKRAHADERDATPAPHDSHAGSSATRPASHAASGNLHAATHPVSHTDGRAATPTTGADGTGADETDADETCEAATDATRGGSFDAPASSSCAHCLSRPGQTPVYTRAREQQNARRDSTAPATPVNATHATHEAQFIPALRPRTRGAPPGQRPRRHVLNSIFLI